MKEQLPRRDFIKMGMFALAAAKGLGLSKRQRLRLSFSTLGCPDWNFQKILDFAAANAYSGLEIRGILRQMDLVKCPEFADAGSRKTTMHRMEDKRLQFVDLGSSAEMHHTDATEREKQLDEAKRFIDLAAEIDCPFVRVFPNKMVNADPAATIDVLSSALTAAGDHARGSGVMVLMETHGEVVDAGLIRDIMQRVNHPKVGLVWDVANMWTVTKQPPADVYAQLKPYVHHTHIKDAKLVNNVPQYQLMGQGEVPIFDAIRILRESGYRGFYSFEWEKLWHPEIDDPAVAIAQYPKAMKEHFTSLHL
ncbi:MAG TPA: sugar phosphate isomerase/epimerase family protein [Chitinophagaceae bacterium]